MAETPSSIRGTVTDMDGEALPGVVVTAQSQSIQRELTTVTRANGEYAFLNVAPGEYTLTAVMTGFKTEQKDARVSPNEATVVDFQLSPGPVEED